MALGIVIALFTTVLILDRFALGSAIVGDINSVMFLKGGPGIMMNLGFMCIVVWFILYVSYLLFRKAWIANASTASCVLSLFLLAVAHLWNLLI